MKTPRSCASLLACTPDPSFWLDDTEHTEYIRRERELQLCMYLGISRCVNPGICPDGNNFPNELPGIATGQPLYYTSELIVPAMVALRNMTLGFWCESGTFTDAILV